MFDYKSSDSDEDIIILAAQAACIAAASTMDFFADQEFDVDRQNCVDQNIGVRDYLATISSTPYMFKTITNFDAEEFEELCYVVCPVIVLYARHTGELRGQSGRPCKLSPQQRLLNFVMFLTTYNTTTFDSCQWNWARSRSTMIQFLLQAASKKHARTRSDGRAVKKLILLGKNTSKSSWMYRLFDNQHWFNGPRKCIASITQWLLNTMGYSYTSTLDIQESFMMSIF